jgi:hypothetical protein
VKLDVALTFAPCAATQELAIRHAARVIDHGRPTYESFAPGAWGSSADYR